MALVVGGSSYLIPTSSRGTISNMYTLGFDFKRTNNNLALGGVSVSKRNVNLFQLMLSFHSGIDLEPVTASFEIEGFVSPGQWLANQSEVDFQSLRPNSKPRYFYARSAVSLKLRFHKHFSVNNFLRGQWSTTNLLLSEEFGVGGYNTVRGYKEREVNGDNAFVWNFELRTTLVSLLNYVFHKRKYPDKLQVLVFYDLGWESVKRATKVEDKRELLMSVGPGLRYNIRTNVNLKVDWGIQLKNVHTPVGTFSNHNRLHFSLIVGY